MRTGWKLTNKVVYCSGWRSSRSWSVLFFTLRIPLSGSAVDTSQCCRERAGIFLTESYFDVSWVSGWTVCFQEIKLPRWAGRLFHNLLRLSLRYRNNFTLNHTCLDVSLMYLMINEEYIFLRNVDIFWFSVTHTHFFMARHVGRKIQLHQEGGGSQRIASFKTNTDNRQIHSFTM